MPGSRITAAKVETVSEDEQMSTKSLAMLAAVLGPLLFIGGEAKWYSAIARATTITGHAGVVDAERRSALVEPAGRRTPPMPA